MIQPQRATAVNLQTVTDSSEERQPMKLKLLILSTLSTIALLAQSSALAPPIKQQFLDQNGKPLNGGLLYSYSAGTSSPLSTYVDNSGSATNSNPIVLDAAGRANVWLGTSSYKFVLTNSAGAVQYTVDNVSTPNLATTVQLAGSTMTGSLLATNGAIDLGDTSHQWANLWLSNTLKIGGVTVIDSGRNMSPNNVTLSGAILSSGSGVLTTTLKPVDGTSTIGTSGAPYNGVYTTVLTATGVITMGTVTPSGDNTVNLGSGTAHWNQLYSVLGTFGGTVSGAATAGQINLYNNSNGVPVTLVGMNTTSGSGLQYGATGAGAFFPATGAIDLGVVGTPWRFIYGATIVASTGFQGIYKTSGGVAGVTSNTCTAWTSGLCTSP